MSSGASSAPPAPTIRVLPEELASQIAAGEVVERPASVVKELVENAIDAGATRVDVAIEQGGKRRVQVLDNGCGMTPQALRLALQRHATSKLRTVEDLAHIRTLGFRGEALPSIASVSRMTLVSRPEDAVAGTECQAHPGRAPVLGETGCPVGTRVVVEDLFFNVPARLKFLKTDRTESAHVHETLIQIGLAHPEVHLTFTDGARRVLDLPRHPDLLARATAALARRGSGDLHGLLEAQDGYRLEAALGSPLAAVSGARNVYLLVNGRAVRDRLLLRMVAAAYGGLLPQGRYPVAVVHLHLPETAVDVNVHPQKQEVRFAEERRVASFVRRALAQGVTEAPWVSAAGVSLLGEGVPARTYRLSTAKASPAREAAPAGARGAVAGTAPAGARAPVGGAAPAGTRAPVGGATPAGTRAPFGGAVAGAAYGRGGSLSQAHGAISSRLGERRPRYGGPTPGLGSSEPRGQRPGLGPGALRGTTGPGPGALRGSGSGTEPLGLPGAATRAGDARPRDAGPRAGLRGYRYIGQLLGTYLLLEAEDGLLLVDQHAAHERVTYARLRASRAQGGVAMQRLLFPVTVALSETEAATLQAEAEGLGRFGFDVSLMGERTAAVRGVPSLLAEADPEVLVRDLLGELAGAGVAESLDAALDRVWATLACHSSVRAGQRLGEAEVAALLEALDHAEQGGHCPHGRPVVLRLSETEIRRRFQRE